jgi:hypothetical protein
MEHKICYFLPGKANYEINYTPFFLLAIEQKENLTTIDFAYSHQNNALLQSQVFLSLKSIKNSYLKFILSIFRTK